MTTGTGRRAILLDLWLVACGVFLVLFVAWNPPLLWMARRLVPLVFAVAFLLSYAGFGSLIIRTVLPEQPPLDRFLIATALGIGLTSLMVFALGVAGVVLPWIYALWTLSGLAIFAVIWMLDRPEVVLKVDLRRPLALLATVIIAPTVLHLVPSLTTPPTSTDELEYHLLVPKIYMQAGEIVNIPYLCEASYPSLAEYIYMPVMALADDITCKGVHFLIGLCLAAAIACMVRRASPSSGRLLAPALFLSMPLVCVMIAVAWNDAIFVFFMVLGLNQLLDHHSSDRSRIRHLLLAGVCVGLAAWTKYTVVMMLLSMLPLLAVAVLKWRWKWWHVAVFAAPIGAISLLVFVKNWAFTGNPFFPFLSQIFESAYWSEAAAGHFSRALREWEIAEWGWATYLTFPFHITLLPRLVDIHTGIVPLVLAPFLFVRSRTSELTFLKVFLAGHLAAWFLIHTENRSLLTMIAVAICVGVIGMEQVLERRPAFTRPIIVLLAAASLTNFGMAAVNNLYLNRPIPYFIGREHRSDFLLHDARSQRAYHWLNEGDSVGRVLLVGYRGPYHLHRTAYFSSFSDPPIAETMSAGATSPEDILRRFTAQGITHVAVDTENYRLDHERGLYSWSGADRQRFDAFIDQHCREVARFGIDRIYLVGVNSES